MEGLFKNTLKTIDNEGFINRSRSETTAFTRNRKFTFKDLLVTLMSFTRPSVQTELDRFFKALAKSPESFDSISKSAFTQSRKKLKPEAFIELGDSQLSYFAQKAPNKKTWKGKRVVAIDGSLLNLPVCDELREEFGFVRNQYEEVISARCSFAYDVCNELVLAAEIDRRKSCEKDLASRHLSRLDPETDILVFDRGYQAFWLMGLLEKKGFKFCFRLSTAWKEAFEAIRDKTDIDWIPKKCRDENGKMKQYGLPLQFGAIRLIAVELPSGETEILATNLDDRSLFAPEDLKELYHLRWGVEESYKSFKKVLHIEHFSGKTAPAIRQDFHARIFMLNMASMVRTQGLYREQHNTGRKKSKHKKQPNKTQVLAKTKDFVIDLFYNNNLKKLISQMLRLLRKSYEIIRPGRSFPRTDKSSRRRNKGLNFKGI